MRILLFLLFVVSSHFTQAQETNILLHTPTGEVVESQKLMTNGKAKVFVFWSNYCRFCKLEMKGIRNIGQNWYEDYDAEVIFVSLETYPSDAYSKVEFLQNFKKEGVYWLHDNRMQLYRALGAQAIPTTILFDKDGNLVQQWGSYDDGLERSVGMYFKKLKAAESK